MRSSRCKLSSQNSTSLFKRAHRMLERRIRSAIFNLSKHRHLREKFSSPSLKSRINLSSNSLLLLKKLEVQTAITWYTLLWWPRERATKLRSSRLKCQPMQALLYATRNARGLNKKREEESKNRSWRWHNSRFLIVLATRVRVTVTVVNHHNLLKEEG